MPAAVLPDPEEHPMTVFTVFPLRFTDRPAEMIGFLRALGLAPVLTAGDDAFGDLRAGAGRVMVHGAASAQSGAAHGDTDLCLVVPDAEAAAAELRAAGLEVAVWDETYGKQGSIGLPGGEAISLNEDQADTYGYREHDGSAADPRLEVVAVLSSEDPAADAAALAPLGFLPDGPAGEGWQLLRGPAGAGSIGLHSPIPGFLRSRDGGDGLGRNLCVRLGFRTREDLDALAARLAAAGITARVVEDGGRRSVRIVDPDGIEAEVHAAGDR